MKKLFLLGLFCTVLKAQDVKVSSGSLQRFSNFKSEFVSARNVDVWLPDGYSNNEKYAVLYMHDGQMLYDASTTWNKQAWEVDESVISEITPDLFEKYVADGIISGGMIPKLENAFEAINAGVKQVIITRADLIHTDGGTKILSKSKV